MFPLLHLPLPAFDSFYKFLNVSEIILLSQCSKRVKTIVRNQEGPKRNRSLTFTIDREHANISIETIQANEDDLEKKFSWNFIKDTKEDESFSDEDESFEEELIEYKELKIENICWNVFVKYEDNWQSPVPEQSPSLGSRLLILVELFQNLFKIPIHNIWYEFDSCVAFDQFFKRSPAVCRAQSIQIFSVDGAVANDEMTYMLENFVTEKLKMHAETRIGYSFQGTLNYSTVSVLQAKWMSPRCFWTLASTCKQMELSTACQIRDEVLNQFIKDWMTGDNKTLELVKVTRTVYPPNDSEKPLDEAVILQGIEHTPGANKDEHAARYPRGGYKPPYKYENGVDIRRSDGLMANVLMEYEGFRQYFLFTVWYEELNLVEAVAN